MHNFAAHENYMTAVRYLHNEYRGFDRSLETLGSKCRSKTDILKNDYHDETRTHLEVGLGRKIKNETEYGSHLNNVYEALIKPYHRVYTDPVSKNSLYLGNQTTAGWNPVFTDMDNIARAKLQSEVDQKLSAFKNIGVRAVVCCADNVEVFPKMFKYLQLPMENNSQFQIMPHITKAYDFISQELQHGSVFIHCNAGVTRSASTVIYFLMRKYNWNYRKAHQYLYKIRPCIDTELFRPQLEAMETASSKASGTGMEMAV